MNYFYGYLIIVVLIMCGIMVVVIGRNCYLVYFLWKSVLMDVWYIFVVGIKNKFFCKRNLYWIYWFDGVKDIMGGVFFEEMVEVVKFMVYLFLILFIFIFYWIIYG